MDHVKEVSIEEGKFDSSAPNDVGALIQKLLAVLLRTYFLIFARCGAVAVNKIYGLVSFPGVCITWGLAVMVLSYSIGHISGAHFNPAVTIAFAFFYRFPWLQFWTQMGFGTLTYALLRVRGMLTEMMNQGFTTDAVDEQDPNLLEKCQIVALSGLASTSLTPGVFSPQPLVLQLYHGPCI